MQNLTLSDYVLAAMIAMLLIGKIFRLAGWNKWALIADELEKALQDARGLFAGSRDALNVERASEAVAAQIKGATATDVKPIVESLVNNAADKRYGVSITLDKDGNVRVDPSNLAAKLTRKAGKWFKKVF